MAHLARLQQQQNQQLEVLSTVDTASTKDVPSSAFMSPPFCSRGSSVVSLPFVNPHRRIHSSSWLPEPSAINTQTSMTPATPTGGLFRRFSMGQAAGGYPLTSPVLVSPSVIVPLATTSPAAATMTQLRPEPQKVLTTTSSAPSASAPNAPIAPQVTRISAHRLSTPFTAFGEPDSLSEWVEDDMSSHFASTATNEVPRGRALRRRSEAPRRTMSPTSERILQGNCGAF